MTIKDMLKELIIHERKTHEEPTGGEELEDVLEEARTWLEGLWQKIKVSSPAGRRLPKEVDEVVFDAEMQQR